MMEVKGEAAQVTGCNIHSFWRKLTAALMGFRKTGRIITIPESERVKLLGETRRWG